MFLSDLAIVEAMDFPEERGWREALRNAGFLAFYTGISSALGILGGLLIPFPLLVVLFPQVFLAIWSNSLSADVTFVVGSILTGIAVYHATVRWGRWVGIAAGLLLSWCVYAFSFLQLSSDLDVKDAGKISELSGDAVGAAFLFTLRWGWMGLAFAGILPSIFAPRPDKSDVPF